MEISVEISQKIKNRKFIKPRYSAQGKKPKGMDILAQRHLLIHVYCCSVHNSQEMASA